MCVAGTAFWHQKDPSKVPHLYVVLNTPTDKREAILVNFTKHEHFPKNKFQLPAKYPWLQSGDLSDYVSTLFYEGIWTISKVDLEKLCKAKSPTDTLEPKLLARVRVEVARHSPMSSKVNAVLTDLLGNWDRE